MLYLIFLISLVSFEEFFTGGYTVINGVGSYYSVSGGSWLISQCQFIGLSNKAIYCSTSSVKLVIGDCFFYQVSSSSNGGAVFYQSSGGSIGIKRVCCYSCVTTSGYSYGSFLYSPQHSNCLIYDSSFAKCVINEPVHEQSSVLFLCSGIIHVQAANTSYNQLRSYLIALISSATSCNYSFSTISNNHAAWARILEVQSCNTCFYRDNFINNSVSDTNDCVFSQYGSGKTSFTQTIFLDCAKTQSQNLLSSSSFLFTECWINIGNIPSDLRQGVTFGTTNPYPNSFFSTHLCDNYMLGKEPTSTHKIQKMWLFGIIAIIQ